MAKGSDTQIGRADSDTMCLGVSPGQRVRISAGLMEGSEATVIQPRTQGASWYGCSMGCTSRFISTAWRRSRGSVRSNDQKQTT